MVLPIPGTHNILNAMAALTIVDALGVKFVDAAKALETFKPTARRFELRADVGGVAIVRPMARRREARAGADRDDVSAVADLPRTQVQQQRVDDPGLGADHAPERRGREQKYDGKQPSVEARHARLG